MNEYKPEIDGLRAIAVVLVLLSHVQLGITGGFIGVDVFFVISGFLITSIIISGIEQKNFSFIQFYGRRFVRLYPALLAVVILTLFAGFILADSEFYAQIARSAKYTVASISNLYFSKSTGYFDLSAQQQPFLHTWTLGVEWQFYLLCPIIIWLCLRRSKKILLIVFCSLFFLSLFASENRIQTNANIAYYKMAYRAFELLIGCLLVFIYQKKCIRLISVASCFTGLGMILAAAVIYSPKTLFPGYAALLPTIGAALCIYGGQDFVKGNVLRLSPFVYIGKISYSVYLVHWPIIVYANYIFFGDITFYGKVFIFLLSILFGVLIYHSIETKITWRRLHKKLCGVFVIFIVGVFIVIFANWIYKHPHALDWRISRLNDLPQNVYEQNNYYGAHSLGDNQGEIYAVLLSDSLGNNLAPGLDAQLQNTGRNISLFMWAGCYMIDTDYVSNKDENWQQECLRNYQEAYAFLNTTNAPLILAQAWDYKNDLIDIRTGEYVLMDRNSDDYKDFIKERLKNLRQQLGSRRLILLASPPYLLNRAMGFESIRPSCTHRPDFIFDTCDFFEGENYAIKDSSSWIMNEIIRDFASNDPYTCYIDPAPAICPNGICNTRHNDDIYLPQDLVHFSAKGSLMVTPYVWEQIQYCIETGDL